MSWALITGASSGIGEEFARQLAQQKYDLVLVARSAEKLERLAHKLAEKYGVQTQVLIADLANRDGMAVVEQRLLSDEDPIDLLVNNAGFGTTAPFVGGPIDQEQEMLDVLVTAVMRLSHAVLPRLVRNRRGGVIIVSSVAGWMPGGTYSAAKSWATTFAESLAGEVRRKGVKIMALCPGFTVTGFHERASIDRNAVPKFMWLDCEAVVRSALRDFRAGKAISTPSVRYKSLGLVMRSVPRWVMRAANVGLSGQRRR